MSNVDCALGDCGLIRIYRIGIEFCPHSIPALILQGEEDNMNPAQVDGERGIGTHAQTVLF